VSLRDRWQFGFAISRNQPATHRRDLALEKVRHKNVLAGHLSLR
jgi:hypothetical protein